MAFEKLRLGENNSYHITKGKAFVAFSNLRDEVDLVFEFAYGMTFGRVGEHRDYRTGGQIRRKNGELFINTFQGKLAEFGIYKYFKSKGYGLPVPELSLWERGVWDSEDFEINKKKISVKSASFFSSLLLLETRDWDLEGKYIPNRASGNDAYDYFILARIKPDGKGIIKYNKLFFSDQVDKEKLKKIISNENWEFDIAGFCTRADIISIIVQNHILPQNSLLNGKTKMDAENYYLQAGDMAPITELIIQLSR